MERERERELERNRVDIRGRKSNEGDEEER